MSRQTALKIVLVLASIIFGLLIAEIALRLMGFTYPVFYTPDMERGYALRPGVEGWYRKEGESYVRINSDGLRDREHSRAKPAGTLRIAIVGDSYAEALQVPVEHAFWAVMRERLAECEKFSGRGTTVEVINFGVSGYGTAQELLTLRHHVWQYQPDLVILTVTTNNDVTDNTRALKKTDEIPYYTLRGEQLVLDDSFRTTPAFRLRQSILNSAGRWFRDHLRFIQAIHAGHGAIRKRIAEHRDAARRAEGQQRPPSANAPPSDATAQTAARLDEFGADNLIYREPEGEVWREAWRVTERLIAQMGREVRDGGARFAVVTLSNPVQAHPEPKARREFLERLGATDLFYPDRRIRELCEREGITSFALAPALQAYAEQKKVFLHGFEGNVGNGHWNSHGHRIAGEHLAQMLCEWW